MLDVRAPVEFARGAFPNATNLPLLDDTQRAAVGERYRQSGRDSAISLGEELIAGELREERLAAWLEFFRVEPGAVVYCYRGGLRSQVVQSWLAEKGVPVPRVEGGYKALRRFLAVTLTTAADRQNLILIAGKTGSGKTHLLNRTHHSVDLEGLANHRGSAFGRHLQGQPSQINFENQLAIDLLRFSQEAKRHLFLEDESRAIGSLSIPQAFHDAMRKAPLAIVEEPLKSRVQTVLNDYIHSNFEEYRRHWPEDHQERFADYLLQSLQRIRRRLGGENYEKVRELMQQALRVQLKTASMAAHETWIERLLTDYYDPMYDYQLGRKAQEVVFRGSRDEFLRWAAKLN